VLLARVFAALNRATKQRLVEYSIGLAAEAGDHLLECSLGALLHV
jgi:hypothetical protein